MPRWPPGGGRPWSAEYAQPLPEFGPKPEDFVVPRIHGITAFNDTGLDSLLRNLGVTTVIAGNDGSFTGLQASDGAFLAIEA